MELLWNQELVFIFNILLSTGLDTFLLEDILKKVNNLNPHFINNIIPFILMNKIHKAT